jgi:hypothetical protein
MQWRPAVSDIRDNWGMRPLDFQTVLGEVTAERDALRERVARLEVALTLYSCEDGCNDCPEHERDRVTCGWTALTALQEDTPNDL